MRTPSGPGLPPLALLADPFRPQGLPYCGDVMGKSGFLLSAVLLAVVTGCASKDDMQSVARRAYTLEQQQETVARSQARLDERLALLETETAKKDKRIAALERALAEAERAQANDMQSMRDQAARFGVEMDALRSDFRKAMGQSEETAYSLEKRLEAVNRMEEIVSRMDVRLSRLEDFVDVEGRRKPGAPPAHSPAPVVPAPALPAAAPAPPVTAPAPPVVPEVPAAEAAKSLNEKDLFAKGKEAVEQGKYEDARTYLAVFLARFGEAKLADNAQYYVGETYFQEKWYERAVLEFQTVIEKYPAGDRVPAALLRQAMSFELMGDKENAGYVYKELIKKFPKSSEATQAKKKLEDLK